MQIHYLMECLEGKQRYEADMFAHIAARQKALHDELAACRREGRPFRGYVPEFGHSMIGRKRLDHLEWCLETVIREAIPGDLMEAGIWRGGACVFMRGYLAVHEIADRVVWAADSFTGLPVPSLAQDRAYDLSAARFPALAIPLDSVREIFARYGLLDDRVRFLEGWFKDSLPNAPIRALAVLRIDGDLYESTRDVLVALYDRVSPGGIIVIDDYEAFPPCREATNDFRSERNIAAPFHRIDWSGVWWRKDGGAPS